jgi:hypothetical protein
MYEEDYIMRIIQEFFLALDKAIHGKKNLDNPSDQENSVSDLYSSYFQADSAFFYGYDVMTIFGFLRERCEEQDLPMMIEMISELFYQDALLKTDDALKANLLEKALFFFIYLDEQSDTYSVERMDKIAFIKRTLGKE